jgi:hypothetical protein
MKVQEPALKKYNVVIPKLFQIILNLPEEKQLALLQHAEELLVKERRDDHIKGTSHRKANCDLLQVVCHHN